MQKQGNCGGKVVPSVLGCGRLLDCLSHDTHLHLLDRVGSSEVGDKSPLSG